MIVIGSTALQIGLQKVGAQPTRTPSDLDVLALPDEISSFIIQAGLKVIRRNTKILCEAPDGSMVEIDPITLGSSNHAYWVYAQTVTKLDRQVFHGVDMEVASLEMLYSLKKAHRHSPRAFVKHVADYNLLRGRIFHNRDILSRITAQRYKETVERERLRTPSLNKSTKEFFDDNVSNRTFIHDQIHEVMAHYDRPLFERYLVEPGSPKCDRSKWEALVHHDKLKAVMEEAYVIALERAMIPMLFEGEKMAKPREAYEWAVMRICTTLCSGWFREFAVENHHLLMLWYSPEYVNKFLRAVESGKIKRIGEGV